MEQSTEAVLLDLEKQAEALGRPATVYIAVYEPVTVIAGFYDEDKAQTLASLHSGIVKKVHIRDCFDQGETK